MECSTASKAMPPRDRRAGPRARESDQSASYRAVFVLVATNGRTATSLRSRAPDFPELAEIAPILPPPLHLAVGEGSRSELRQSRWNRRRTAEAVRSVPR